jgi:hypothetical protein
MVFPVAFKTKGSFNFGSYEEPNGACVGFGVGVDVSVSSRDCGDGVSFCCIGDGVSSLE